MKPLNHERLNEPSIQDRLSEHFDKINQVIIGLKPTGAYCLGLVTYYAIEHDIWPDLENLRKVGASETLEHGTELLESLFLAHAIQKGRQPGKT